MTAGRVHFILLCRLLSDTDTCIERFFSLSLYNVHLFYPFHSPPPVHAGAAAEGAYNRMLSLRAYMVSDGTALAYTHEQLSHEGEGASRCTLCVEILIAHCGVNMGVSATFVSRFGSSSSLFVS